MKSISLNFFIAVFLSLAFSKSFAQASQHTVNNLKEVVEFLKKNPPDNTLIAFDDDDTLTTSLPNQPLGDTAWFKWQAGFCHPDHSCSGPYAVASSFDGLIQAARISITLNKVKLTEDNLAQTLQTLLDTPNTTIIMETARPPNWMNITEYQLEKLGVTDKKKHQYFFKHSGLIAPDGTTSYPALHCHDPLIDEEAIAYQNGSFYVSRVNKGQALGCLLQALDPNKKIKRIIFVDDQQSNIQNMVNYFNANPKFQADVHAFYYTHEKQKQDNFLNNVDHIQEKSDALWKSLEKDIQKNLPDADLPQ
jgi:hypothetical protein